ncbi:MAG TPA: hypothetical protein VLK28_12815, partial [Methylomirabilota bacterium]|nr:hypothetical protein [Methylomirabilota bacterium]
MLAAGIVVALLLSVLAVVLALLSFGVARARRPGEPDGRVAVLEEQVRGLLYRVWQLEGGAVSPPPAGGPAVPAPPEAVAPVFAE